MKVLQEYSNDPVRFTPSYTVAMKQLEKLPLPYTGNKKKIAPHIQDALIRHDVKFKVVLDAFTGSGTVAYLFKMMGKRVIANDLLTSSYLNAVAFVENPGVRLTEDDKEFLLHHQNANKGVFVEENYLGKEFRPKGKSCRFNKFTLKECKHLDNFRANIDELCGIHSQSVGLVANAAVVMRLPFGNVDQSINIMKHRLRQEKNYGKSSGNHDRRIGIYYDEEYNLKFDKWFKKYVSDFARGIPTDGELVPEKIKRASFLANLQQHVLRDCMVEGRFHRGQALCEIKERLAHQKNQLKGNWGNKGSTEMDFFTQSGRPGQGLKWWTLQNDLSGSCVATNMDVVELLKSGACDVECAYFDPPYGGNSSDYATIYRFLEEYIYSQELEDLPHMQSYTSRFVKKRTYEQNFVEMLEAATHIPIWLFSYNDRSWKDIDYITDIIKQFKSDVQVEVLTSEYRYLYSKKQGRDQKSCEYLIIAR